MTSDFLRHEPCDECGSSDGKAIYSDGHTHCFVCNHNTQTTEDDDLPDNENLNAAKKEFRPLAEEFISWKARGFTAQTTMKYNVDVGPKGAKYEAVYPFFNKDGQHVANKIRFPGKEFVVQGDWKSATLFGQQAFPAGSAQQITVTEGQDDAMAVFEMQNHKYPVVSIASASSAKKDVQANYEYLNSFKNIVLCFDNDDPGKKAADIVASMFQPGKVRVMRLQDYKDANEYLLAGEAQKFSKEWWAAPAFTPSGLKMGSQLWDEISAPRKYDTVLYPFKFLNYMTYGIRLSEVVLLTAHTKVGKSSLVREIASFLLKNAKKEYGVGGLFLEESNRDTAEGLMSICANKPLHLPDVRETVTPEDMRKWYDEAVNTDRLVLWDHFGSNTIEEVLNKIRHMAALGCKYIILDHMSIIVSDQAGDERKQLDEISTKLKMLCMELNIAVIAVIHQSRAGQIRGSAGPEQIANITIKLTRDLEDEDEWRRNITKVSIQYNRFCGRTGPAGYLQYDPITGRLNELDAEGVKRFEKSKPDAKKQEDWQ